MTQKPALDLIASGPQIACSGSILHFSEQHESATTAARNQNRNNHEDRAIRLLGHFTFRWSSALDLLLRPQRKWLAGGHGGAVLLGPPRLSAPAVHRSRLDATV